MREPLERVEIVSRRIGALIGDQMPGGWRFMLIVASEGEGGFCNWISNVERESAIELLTEMLTKFKKGTHDYGCEPAS